MAGVAPYWGVGCGGRVKPVGFYYYAGKWVSGKVGSPFFPNFFMESKCPSK